MRKQDNNILFLYEIWSSNYVKPVKIVIKEYTYYFEITSRGYAIDQTTLSYLIYRFLKFRKDMEDNKRIKYLFYIMDKSVCFDEKDDIDAIMNKIKFIYLNAPHYIIFP